MNLKGRDIISINDLNKQEIVHILDVAKSFEKGYKRNKLSGKILATLFFEPSTRTRLSFESAMQSLGGRVIGFADKEVSSFKKGESLADTIKIVEKYCDVIVIRHFLDGSARLAADVASIPVINAGDGANQHPTQTLLDLYAIKQAQGVISKLNVALVGDLKYGRTVHSLAVALALFQCNLYLVSPESLSMPSHILSSLKEQGVAFFEHSGVEEVIGKADIIYATRIQRERFADALEYERVRSTYVLKKSSFKNAKKNLKVLHPLPRVDEISISVDGLPYAYYFEQARCGIPVRQALLSMVLGK
ncbi:MAG: aspartate carbamoyltransferase [Candidatus Woesearchaeota archaeon]